MEITLKNLLDWITKAILFILVVTIVFGVGFFAYTKYFVAPTYVAQVKLFADGDNLGTTPQILAPQCVEVLNVNEFYEMVSKELLETTGESITPEAVAARVDFSSVIKDTSHFYVKVTSSDPNLSYNIAFAIAEKAPERVAQFTKLGTLGVSSYPKLSMTPSGPNVAGNTVIGLLLGLILSVGIVVAREMLDNRIKSADEITELYGLPVFGVVPDFSTGDRKGAKK